MNTPDSTHGQKTAPARTWEQAVKALREDSENAALARDCYFDGTELDAGQRYWASQEWQAARLLLPLKAGRALDVGAGRGIASYALARDGWEVCALEPDASALVGAEAIRHLAAVTGFPIEVHEAFGEQLPFESASFELVVARQSLHHARNLKLLLAELFRVLRPGGRLVALRDHVISRPEDLERFHAVHPLHRLYGGEHAYLLKEYVGAISDAGLVLQKVIGPLDSPINYAPLTQETLADGIAGQLPRLLGCRRLAGRLLRSERVLSMTVSLLGRIDNRPGRLYSFVADRPGG